MFAGAEGSNPSQSAWHCLGVVVDKCSPVVEFRIHDAACGVESATVSCRMPMKRVDLTGSCEGYVPDAGRFARAFENACAAFKREFERG